MTPKELFRRHVSPPLGDRQMRNYLLAVRRKPPGELTHLNRTACAVPLQSHRVVNSHLPLALDVNVEALAYRGGVTSSHRIDVFGDEFVDLLGGAADKLADVDDSVKIDRCECGIRLEPLN